MFMKCNRALGNVFFAADYFACEKTLDFIRMVLVDPDAWAVDFSRPLNNILALAEQRVEELAPQQEEPQGEQAGWREGQEG